MTGKIDMRKAQNGYDSLSFILTPPLLVNPTIYNYVFRL